MAEDFVQVAPDSTGAKMRTRSRVIGANTIEEQYVIVQSEAVPNNRVWLSTLRIPSRVVAAGATQNLFSIWSGIAGGGNSVSVRRLTVEIDTATAYAGLGPFLRLHRMSTQAATPGGTVITPVSQYSSDPTFSTLVSVRADHQGDNAAATTALALGTLNTQPMWSQTCPRMQASGGFYIPTEYNMMPNDAQLMAQDPFILRPSEGMALQLTNGAVALTAGMFTFQVKAVLAEFTYP